jgi:peptidoglycan/xylan/chitin deacetylase (PgdA/CDA1 family)
MKISLLHFFLLVFLPSLPVFAAEDTLPILYLRQKVEITGVDSLKGVKVCPLYKNAQWAVTSRWDDSNSDADLKMSQLMDKYGYKATFYLNGLLDATVVKSILARGHAFGGHSCSHPFFAQCSYNRIVEEILKNRIDIEARTDISVNSFAFPYNQYESATRPTLHWDIYRILRRAGYVHTAYNVFLTPEMKNISQCNQLPYEGSPAGPQFNAFLADSALQKKEPNICFNTHAGSYTGSPGLFTQLEADLKQFAGRKDFWYPTLTDYGAYRFQYKLAKIEDLKKSTGNVSFTLVRPAGLDTNSPIPLSLKIDGTVANNFQITVDGKILPPDSKEKESAVFSVPFPSECGPPSKIDAVCVEGKPVFSPKFPFLIASLFLEREPYQFQLRHMKNGPALKNIFVTLRLPFAAEEPVIRTKPTRVLGPNGLLSVSFDPRWTDRSLAMVQGRAMFVAQVDFLCDNKPSRLYVYGYKDIPSSEKATVYPKDHFAWCGPLATDECDATDITSKILQNPDSASYSLPNGKTVVWEKPLSDWMVDSPDIIISRPISFLTAFIRSPAQQKVKIATDAGRGIWLNKTPVTSGQIVTLNPGLNRIILCAAGNVFFKLIASDTGQRITNIEYVLPNAVAKSITVKPSAFSRIFVRDWLLCGPFPNPGDRPVKKGFDIDYLATGGGEAKITPVKNSEVSWNGKKITWQFYHSPEDRVDLFQFPPIKALTNYSDIVAYAACTLISDRDLDLLLGIGSDDGYKLYLNGTLLKTTRAFRGAAPDQEVVKAHLLKGKNHLLLKIDQDFGQYEFYLSLSSPTGKPFAGLTVASD